MNILTFDIEEWFHILDHYSTKYPITWLNREVRIHQNVQRILDFLDFYKSKATFFCLGWVADKYPEVIRDIVDRGHEIASHSYNHQLVYEQSKEEFRSDLYRSKKLLEDVSGQGISIYRAPGFSITPESKGALESLIEMGFEIDCSIFPARRSHGGLPNFPYPEPAILKSSHGVIKELPISTRRAFGRSFVYSGGGYFRFFPYWLIEHWFRNESYVMTYFHPRDFDSEQPIISDLSKQRRYKSYVGIKQAPKKFERLLSNFEFVDVSTANRIIDWDSVPVYDIGD